MSRFTTLFDDIRASAVERERERRLPFAEIAALRDAGFTALRVPVELGGGGASLPELFDLLIELAAADPNLPQALRGHFGFVERLLIGGTGRDEERLRRIADGALVGNSQAERGPATSVDTRLERAGDAWRLTGTKFYTTGTLYADWTWTTALDEHGTPHGVVVPTSRQEVTVTDDWGGFGQRLTGSGTTVFDGVPLTDEHVYPLRDEPDWYSVDNRVFLHLLLQATLAGIGAEVRDDAVRFVRARTRAFGIPGESEPRHDPRVQTVVGEVASRVAAVEALVRDVVRDYAATRAREHDDETQRTDDYVRVQVRQFEAQQVAVADILAVTTQLFEVGGAQAVLADRGLDRHWRNARTIASHNPAILRKAAIGDYLLNGTAPELSFR